MTENEKRAREAIRRVLKGAQRSLSKEGNWIWVRNHMRAASLERLIEVARNGEPAEKPHAIEVLRERARSIREANESFPPDLCAFALEHLIDGPPRGARGEKAESYALRNTIFPSLMREISKEFGFAPTRNEATEGHCVCSLIADEIRSEFGKRAFGKKALDERGLAEIWRNANTPDTP